MTPANHLRRQLRARRKQITGESRTEKTSALIARVLSHRIYKAAKHVAFYSAFDGEVDISALLLHAYNNNKCCYLPVIPKFAARPMRFAPYLADAAQRTNHFGIYEPVFQTKHLCPATKLDLVLMPLVGFDDKGQRLGMGGGFYDRCFEFRRYRKHWLKPRLLGIAFDCQKVGAIEKNPWDVAMDACVTEAAWYQF